MKLIVTKNYESMSRVSAQIVLTKMLSEYRVNMSLTAGNTPKRMYEILANELKDIHTDFKAHFYNFDEIGIKNEAMGVTMQELTKSFYVPCGIDKEFIHEMTADNYQDIAKDLSNTGGIDLIVIGIGEDGHFCANMPQYTQFENDIYTIEFDESSVEYKMMKEHMGIEPTGKGVTFGPKTVLNAKQILLFANGKHKAEILKKALEGPVTSTVPASILKLHPNLTVVLDEDAASLLTR